MGCSTMNGRAVKWDFGDAGGVVVACWRWTGSRGGEAIEWRL